MEVDPAPAREAGSSKEPQQPQVHIGLVAANDDDEDDSLPPDATQCVFVVYHAEKASKPEPPKEFRERPAFLELEQEGLTDIPPAKGCGIYYHNSTSQWHVIYGHSAEKHSAPSWNSTLRSERKAILMAMVSMWTWYCEESTHMPDHKYLAILVSKLKATTFWIPKSCNHMFYV